MFNIRFVAYSIDGTRLGAIPTPLSFQMRMPLLDIPTLQITWTDKIPAYAILDDLPVLAAEWSDGGQWTEFLDGRFYPAKHNWDRLDDTGAHSCDYKGLIGALDETLVWGGANTDEGRRKFENKTPTQIFTPIFNEARNRGSAHFLLTLRNDITGTQTACTREYELGNTVFSVLQDLTSVGEFEYRVDGTALVLANRVGSDLTTNRFNPVWVRDILSSSSPEEHDYSQICNAARLVSDNNKVWTSENQASIALYGRREKMISQAGVTDTATARQILAAYLNTYADFQPSYSREYPVDGTNRPLPGRDFNPGDATYVDTQAGHKVRLRISEISYKQDSAGTLTAYVTFGALTQSTLAKLAKTQAAITGGASISPIGVGSPPYTPGVPAQPLGFRVEPSSYINETGDCIGAATLTWQPVGTTVDGQEIIVRAYWCGWRTTETGAPWNITHEVTTTSCDMRNLPAGVDLEFCVAAVSKWGVVGLYATSAPTHIPLDLTPPPAPSTPILESRLGTLYVYWNGKDYQNQEMPIDLDHLNVYIGGQLAGAMSILTKDWFTTSLTVGNTYTVTATAVDKTGNESTASTAATITIVGVVNEADIQDALQNLEEEIQQAQQSAQGNGRVFYNSENNPPVATSLNDTWFTAEGRIMKPTAVGSTSWNPITLADLALQGISANKVTGQIAETQIAAGAITTNKIATGAITADSGIIANAAITNAMIASLDAAKITTGTLNAARVGANSITVDKLVVTGGNIFPDPNLTNTAAWKDDNNNTVWPLTVRGRTNTVITYDPGIELPLTVEPGTYRLGAYLDATVATNSNFTVTFVLLLASEPNNQTAAASIFRVSITQTGKQWCYATLEVPEKIGGQNITGAATIAFTSSNTGVSTDTARILKITLQRASDNNLIVDGAITANKIAANAISSDKIEAGAITATKLDTNALNFKTAQGLIITAGTISGTTITGSTITGGTLQTATTGERFQLDITGLKSYNSENELTSWINGSGVSFYYGDRHLGQFNQGPSSDLDVRGIGMSLTDQGDFLSINYLENSVTPPVYKVSFVVDPRGRFSGAPGIRIYDPIVCGNSKNSSNQYTQMLQFCLMRNPNNGYNYAALMNTTGRAGFAFGGSGLFFIADGIWYSLSQIVNR